MSRIASAIFLAGALLVGAFNGLAQPPALPKPPSIPNAAAPTEVFRKLLAMGEAERASFIAAKPEASQQILRAKVKEYLTLAPAAREARLQSLELRWYMLPLMKLPGAERARAMTALPEDKRSLVEPRLRTWDILPPPLKLEVLENESVVRFFVQAQESGTSHEELLRTLSPAQRAQMESDFGRWTNVPPARRERMFANVDRFFGQLDPKARTKTLRKLDEPERAQMQRTLKTFEGLPEAQRQRLVDGFKKFKDLAPADRQAFLKSADQWQTMSDKDRQLWRLIINQTRRPPALPIPPFPQSRSGRLGSSLVATN